MVLLQPVQGTVREGEKPVSSVSELGWLELLQGGVAMDRLPEHCFIKPTPYQTVMDLWHRWHLLKDKPESKPNMHPQDLKEFIAAAEAAESMINDLPRHLWWAVWKSRGICNCWNFPNISLVDAVEEAEKRLTPKMQQHIDTKQFFR